MGFFSDFVSDPIGTLGDAGQKIINNPIPALYAAGTGNPTALLAYAAPTQSGSTGGSGTSGGATGGWFSGLTNVLGGISQNETNKAAAQQTAGALQRAGLQAQGLSQFRPVGITNTFGTSQFTINPQTGQLESAGYSLSPSLQASQNALMGNQAQNLTDLSSTQNIGRGYLEANQGAPITALGQQYMQSQIGNPLTQAGLGYLSQSPQQAAQQYIQNQQALLAPGREQAWANLANQDYNRGTMGLKVAQGGNLQSANPYAAALANAQAQQDLALAAQAQQQGLAQQQAGAGLFSQGTGLTQAQQLAGANLYGSGLGLTQQGKAFGQGLLSSAYQPYTAGLQAAAATEQLAQQPFGLSTNLAQQQSTANANAARLGLAGNVAAAQILFPALQQNNLATALQSPSLATGLGQWLSGSLGGLSGVPSWTTGSDVIPQSTFGGYGDVTDLAQYGVF